MENLADYPLAVVTPVGTVYSARVLSVVAPGLSGRLGVLARHMPLLCVLRPGPLLCHEASGVWLQFEVEAGILEVTPEGAEIIVDDARRVPLRVSPRF
ncbi:MAG: F0F1 ATP synthase subunit epsilon [Candidatus Eisenbacteria bacterium]|jgi:F-type H+-transporting ATPase subunit epsilon|nr:F0F1 ATP synthase subunit epsilon [Candidatus Eisenbacteria bacterium]